jgi:alkylated DNA repair dioxygenase AlkB
VAWTRHMAARRTASMGVPYNYGGASYPVSPWHPAVAALAERVAPVAGFSPTNCLLNYYPTGQHRMGWHSDDTTILREGTGIAILSLGTARTLRLRCQDGEGFHYEDLPLPGGSLLFMSAEMQAHWRHSIGKESTEAPRVSLSFREIVRWPDEPPPVPPR